ncbi:MAG: UDP-N-acetylmuramoyl-L-alanyl-D-glutamate--2,6-diaminopimelate ligase [Oscillospiraceae bacterium]|nr:UDP-N-acetylmuramoyl-L-alanyl-D-glutamate--2,6-diaminopimelate ligase [Oscillospiraceae bacterium]
MRLISIDELRDIDVSGVCDDSREFESGDVFVCIKGDRFDGHGVAAEMLQKGAAAVVVERDLGLDRQIIVPNTRKFLAKAASAFYDYPTKDLKLIGATGTNGKSTVIAMIKHILESCGFRTASIGTVGYDCARLDGEVYDAELTVPRQLNLYRLLREAADNGAKYCVIEASSQALAQHRFADGEMFETAVFTNLTSEHLDYHGSMERYYAAKQSLFDMAKSAVVSVDDKYGERLAKYVQGALTKPVLTYSIKDYADNYALNIKSKSSGTSFLLSSEKAEKSFPLALAMPGVYNAANAIAAVSACELLNVGIGIEQAVAALSGFKGVKGRSEIIYSGDFTIIRDYAHTEDALLKFLSSVRGYTPRGNRLICVFGAAGERDAEKRPAMGEAAEKYADMLIITSDNPRFENQQDIINQVAKGIKTKPYESYTDRKQAIEAAVKSAKKGDVIALCGKGHETVQVIGDEGLPFDEKEIVAELME